MNVVLFLIVSCIYATALPQKSYNANDEDHETTIIGGTNAKRNQFPYIVSLQVSGHHWCGAVIISESWLVTSTRCFPIHVPVPIPVKKSETHNPIPVPINTIAVAGSLILGESRKDIQVSPVERVINHPNWRGSDNDIALVKLWCPLHFTESVKPVQMPKTGIISSGKAVVAGWGSVNADSWYPSSALQYLEMDLISNQECNKILADIPGPSSYPWLIRKDRMCALSENSGDSICVYDYGGPLVQNNTLVGIVHESAHLNCNKPLKKKPYPNIFTNVSSVINFINLYAEL